MCAPSGEVEGSVDSARILELEAEVAALRAELAEHRRKPLVGLVWEDKPEVVQDQMQHELPVLRSMPSRNLGDDNARPHLLIEGDNLHALSCLQYTHAGEVDVAYLDPPYNRGGSDFRYNDSYVDLDDAWRHSKWLSFMNRRLRLAHELLRTTGVALIAIDDTEQAHLRLLCDQIFGAHNFIAQVVWQGGRKNDSRFVSVGHDYMLVYAKSKQALIDADVRWRERKAGIDEILAAGKRCWAKSGDDPDKATAALKEWFRKLPAGHPARGSKHYNHIDGQGRVFFPADISWPGGGGPTYEVLHPVTGKPCTVPRRGWLYPTAERMQEFIDDDRVHFGPDHTKVPNKKSYLQEIDSQVPVSVFDQDRRAANKQLAAMVGVGKFPFPKDVDVLARWLKIVAGPDAVVLDFFAGSGSTGHAVAALNAADSGTRQAILVTNNEAEICAEVTYPRLKAVLTGKWRAGDHDAVPGSLRYYRCEFVPITRNRDAMLRRLASRAGDIVAIRENTHGHLDHDEGRYTVLTDGNRRVVVWCDWTDDGLADVLAAHAGDGENVVYLFGFGDTIDPDIVAAHPDWRVEALPEPLRVALERAHARSCAR